MTLSFINWLKNREEKFKEHLLQQNTINEQNFWRRLRYLEQSLSLVSNKQEKLDIIGFFQELTRKQLKYEFVLKQFEHNIQHSPYNELFPWSNYGEKIGNKTINTKHDCIIPTVYDKNKLIEQIKIWSNKSYDEMLHHTKILWFEPFKIGVASCGIHRLIHLMDDYERKIEVSVYDVSKMINKIKSDGIHWIEIKTGKIISIVYDFRLALLVESERLKQGIISSNDGNYSLFNGR